MKRVSSILAVAILSISLFSCEAESSVEETQALYETTDVQANDKAKNSEEGSGGN